jgi:hypothetical protein
MRACPLRRGRRSGVLIMSESLYLLSFWIAASGLIMSACTVGWQLLQWLQFGIWIPVTVLDAMRELHFDYPRFKRIGVQKIADYVIAAPLSLAILLLAVAFALLISAFASARRERERGAIERERKAQKRGLIRHHSEQ